MFSCFEQTDAFSRGSRGRLVEPTGWGRRPSGQLAGRAPVNWVQFLRRYRQLVGVGAKIELISHAIYGRRTQRPMANGSVVSSNYGLGTHMPFRTANGTGASAGRNIPERDCAGPSGLEMQYFITALSSGRQNSPLHVIITGK